MSKRQEIINIVGGNANYYSHYRKKYEGSSKKLKRDLPYNHIIQLSHFQVHIHPKEIKSAYERNTCFAMFTAALFTIAKTWKPARCSSVNECIQKIWYTYVMEYYSTIEELYFAKK